MISGTGIAFAALAGPAAKPFLGSSPPRRTSPLPAVPRNGPGMPQTALDAARFSVDPALLRRALFALDQHSGLVKARDRMAIVDFTAPSSDPRLHFLDVVSGKASRLLVAHGSGSDPGHTGFLERFSNAFGSNASSEGAFLTGDYYTGKHGRSQRLVGLDPTNNNALSRAIVIHSAWYANDDMISAHGKLGRSQGCFAVGEDKLSDVFSFLGEGRMVFAARA
ncbi:murein L,D-transpeptidase catalytic domain family protein [Novosphingobium resinovorum]|uniref:murein L,D-transpeptidase catalytic domain family protein n=1 Tax=Novosphingobium resinovorum TaxID=158500 RepID=UPI002ECFD3B6|nr:murein L,D-transpeptidase catalytic domain family protein [Novosphingobium resinovorum]